MKTKTKAKLEKTVALAVRKTLEGMDVEKWAVEETDDVDGIDVDEPEMFHSRRLLLGMLLGFLIFAIQSWIKVPVWFCLLLLVYGRVYFCAVVYQSFKVGLRRGRTMLRTTRC